MHIGTSQDRPRHAPHEKPKPILKNQKLIYHAAKGIDNNSDETMDNRLAEAVENTRTNQTLFYNNVEEGDDTTPLPKQELEHKETQATGRKVTIGVEDTSFPEQIDAVMQEFQEGEEEIKTAGTVIVSKKEKVSQLNRQYNNSETWPREKWLHWRVKRAKKAEKQAKDKLEKITKHTYVKAAVGLSNIVCNRSDGPTLKRTDGIRLKFAKFTGRIMFKTTHDKLFAEALDHQQEHVAKKDYQEERKLLVSLAKFIEKTTDEDGLKAQSRECSNMVIDYSRRGGKTAEGAINRAKTRGTIERNKARDNMRKTTSKVLDAKEGADINDIMERTLEISYDKERSTFQNKQIMASHTDIEKARQAQEHKHTREAIDIATEIIGTLAITNTQEEKDLIKEARQAADEANEKYNLQEKSYKKAESEVFVKAFMLQRYRVENIPEDEDARELLEDFTTTIAYASIADNPAIAVEVNQARKLLEENNQA